MGREVNQSGGRMKDVFVGPARWSNVTMKLAGTLTLTVDSPTMLFIDPDGARNLVLPAEADSDGLFFIIVNQAGSSEVITIQEDTPATVCTPDQNETALVFCDGTTWEGLVGANS